MGSLPRLFSRFTSSLHLCQGSEHKNVDPGEAIEDDGDVLLDKGGGERSHDPG